MRQTNLSSLTLTGLIGLVGSAIMGCNAEQSKTTTAVTPINSTARASDADQPLVDRVEYVNWSHFPLGTSITLVRETKSEVDKVIVTTISRLAEISDDKVVIETQITVDRGKEPLRNPPMTIEYPANFRLPLNMDASIFALPAQNAKATGEESIQFEGKDYQAVIYSWTGSSEAGPTKNKMWFSNEIPGRLLRHEMSCKAFTSLESITAIEIPKT